MLNDGILVTDASHVVLYVLQVKNGTQSVSISTLSCPSALPFPDCELVDGPAAAEADYPACCPRVRCPDRCYSAQVDRWFSVGDEWQEDFGCMDAYCDGTDSVTMKGCSEMIGSHDCRYIPAEHPTCCDTWECAGPGDGCYEPDLERYLTYDETLSFRPPGCGQITC